MGCHILKYVYHVSLEGGWFFRVLSVKVWSIIFTKWKSPCTKKHVNINGEFIYSFYIIAIVQKDT